MLFPHRRWTRAAPFRFGTAGLLLLTALPGFALDPHKLLTQYSQTTWTQEHGLPQDSIRAIAQTTDGYLWLGTDEGLARFDGYDFAVFDKTQGRLPSNSISALAAASDGTLWIGTPEGLTRYRDRTFRTYTVKDGLPDSAITGLYEDHAGTLWIVSGVSLSRFDGSKFTNLDPGAGLPVTSARAVAEDRQHDIWVAGFTAVVRQRDGGFETVMSAPALEGDIITCMVSDREDHMWIGGNHGIIERWPDGRLRRYGVRDGLPDLLVRALSVDRDGNLWAGTNLGVARFENGRWSTLQDGRTPSLGLVRALFEDREGNLWVGSNNGLTRFRDTIFTMYGKTEGLPSDEPNAVFQDRSGRVWIGFHDSGLLMMSPAGNRLFTPRDGLPNSEIFSIRQARNGDLLIAARGGLIRMHDGVFTKHVPPDPLARISVFDALEDEAGAIWLASPGGLFRMRGREFETVVLGAPLLASSMVTLCEGRDGTIWAGSFGRGLWRVQGGGSLQITMAQGLSSDQIRSLYQDRDGTLWIGTFGGGLNAYKGGRFFHFREQDGLLSDNVADVVDDGESLWLSTTRGICRVPRRQLWEFVEHKRSRLEPVNYGVEDGLRSAQCSPSYPAGGGGAHTSDGRNWFTTTRGVAVYTPDARRPAPAAPPVHISELSVDGHPLDLDELNRLAPNSRRIQFRYSAIHLSAPEQVRYSYRLDGLDRDWIQAGARRTINYNSLHHGQYRFIVRAQLPGGPASERSYDFEVLPQFFETAWFQAFAALAVMLTIWGGLRLRVRQIRSRFALVLEERARLAREIHDTLAQGFVGISSQLDAVAMCMPDETAPARKHLDMARRMARHSLTEARRSVMDLRASALEGQHLAAALQSGTRMWTAGSGVEVDVDVSGPDAELPDEVEQHLLRIAQEAVTNVLKHAGASKIWIMMHTEARKIYLKIRDNGRGFEQDGVFSSLAGHFGLIGMRERAERLGGELRLASRPGQGTEVEVMVPLP